MNPRLVIIDTDPGIDDSAAIFLALRSPELTVECLTTVFGNVMREAAGGGKAWISSMTKRAGPGAGIDIPLAHKDALYVRSHYDGISLTLPDAPLPDEIAIICAYANRERLNSRVGGLSKEKIRASTGSSERGDRRPHPGEPRWISARPGPSTSGRCKTAAPSISTVNWSPT